MENVNLKVLQHDVNVLKRTVAEMNSFFGDAILTDEENRALDASIENYRNKKFVDFEKLKRELRI